MTVLRINYQGLIEAIRGEINTQTAALNTNLDTSVKQIYYGDPTHLPIPVNQYPAVIVHLLSKTEEWEELGSMSAGDSGFKRAHVEFEILGLVVVTSGSDNSDKQVRYLASNIEGIIRNNVRLTNYANLLWITPTETEFADQFRDGVHLSSATIKVECEYSVQSSS